MDALQQLALLASKSPLPAGPKVPAGEHTWHNGFECVYTGKSIMVGGAPLYELRVIEEPRVGELRYYSKPPGISEGDWAEQQRRAQPPRQRIVVPQAKW